MDRWYAAREGQPVLGVTSAAGQTVAPDDRPIVARLQRALDDVASPARRLWWKRYLRGAIAFRGVGIPQIRCEGRLHMEDGIRRVAGAIVGRGLRTVVREHAYHPRDFPIVRGAHPARRALRQDAVGWILRDLSKHDAPAVTAFVEAYLPYFSIESLGNASKYAPATRRRFVERLKAVQRRARAVDGPRVMARRA